MNALVDRFNDSLIDNNLICTNEELSEYLNYGVLFKQGKDYYDRSFKKININKPNTLSIDLRNIISISINVSKSKYCKKIYCMTNKTFNRYYDSGYIISKNNNYYYRFYNNEEWLVNIIDN